MHENSPRTVVITGASDGIGAAASRQLASSGVRLVLVGRSPEKTRKVAAELGAEYHLADFAHLDEVRGLAAELRQSCDRIDVLANNAGGIFPGPTVTIDGFEKTFQVNHLAPYLLTNLLLDQLLDSQATVVNTSSIAACLYGKLNLDDLNGFRRFRQNRAYGNSKLANIIFTEGLHQHFHADGLSVVAFHPGIVATSFADTSTSYLHVLFHTVLNRFLLTPEQGGDRLRYFIEGTPSVDWVSGEYYAKPGKVGRTKRIAYSPSIVREHWDRSAQLLGVEWPESAANG